MTTVKFLGVRPLSTLSIMAYFARVGPRILSRGVCLISKRTYYSKVMFVLFAVSVDKRLQLKLY